MSDNRTSTRTQGPRGMGAAQRIERPKSMGPTVRRLFGMLRPDCWLLGVALIASMLSVGLGVAAPRILGQGTDIIFNGVASLMIEGAPSKEAAVAALEAQGQHDLARMLSAMDVTPGAGIDFGALGRILLICTAIYAGSALISFLGGWVIRTVVQNAGWRLRDSVQAKIERLPLSYFDSHSRGDLMSRVANDVDNVTQVLNQSLSQFLQASLQIVGILVMMFSLSWRLTLLALIVLPFGLLITGVIMKRAQPHFRTQWKATGEVSGQVEEAITGHEVLSLYGLEDRMNQDFEASNRDLYRSSFSAQFLSNLVMPIMQMISNASYVVVAVGGGLLVANGSMSLGSVQAFIQYSRQFTQPIGQIASMANSLQSGAASAERVFEFLDSDEMPEQAPTATLPEQVRGRVVFDHVRFSYTPGTPIIQDLSLSVEPGQMVAIIGPTGAGKTTLVNLLMRFYDLDSGSITLDGVNIADVDVNELRDRMGMVLQETWLFDGTIEENIAFGGEGTTPEDVRDAARRTAADRLIRQLPGGYDTRVSDDSSSISVGERQLLTIARAFVSRPDILILDEATSSVDTRTEILVQQAMDTLRAGRTAFVIAHRLSTIRDADLIMVMEAGDVVEMGRHDELLERGGAYARLYNAQFASSEEEIEG